jgi:DNA-binding CsgD family transcriptional regulator
MIQFNTDISDELIVQRCGQGVRLVQSDAASCHHTSVADLMQLPVNIYMMDGDSRMQKLNTATAETCGYVSVRNALGRSVRDVSRRGTVEHIIHNDREVMRTQSCMVTTESYTRRDDLDLTAISIKFPLFDGTKTAGIMGISILQGYAGAPAIAEAVRMLMQTGLLAHTAARAAIPGWEYDGVYFDEREAEIMRLLVRGKTAKNIAKYLGLSFRTVEHALEKIKVKMQVSSKSELIEKIIDHFPYTRAK